MNKNISWTELITAAVLGTTLAIGLIDSIESVTESIVYMALSLLIAVGFILVFKSIRIVLHDFIEALNPPEKTLSDFVKGIVEESATHEGPKKPKHWIPAHWTSDDT